MTQVFINALAAFALTRIIRALPYFRTLVAKKVKPVSCDTCMSFWTCLIIAAVWSYDSNQIRVDIATAISVMASIGITMLLLHHIRDVEFPSVGG